MGAPTFTNPSDLGPARDHQDGPARASSNCNSDGGDGDGGVAAAAAADDAVVHAICDNLFAIPSMRGSDNTAPGAQSDVPSSCHVEGDWLGVVDELAALGGVIDALASSMKRVAAKATLLFRPLEEPGVLSMLLARVRRAHAARAIVPQKIAETLRSTDHTDDVSLLHIHVRGASKLARTTADALVADLKVTLGAAENWITLSHAARREIAVHAVMVPRGSRETLGVSLSNPEVATASAPAVRMETTRADIQRGMFHDAVPGREGDSGSYGLVDALVRCRAQALQASVALRDIEVRLAANAAAFTIKAGKRFARVHLLNDGTEHGSYDEIKQYLAKRSASKWALEPEEAVATAELAETIVLFENVLATLEAVGTGRAPGGPAVTLREAGAGFVDAIRAIPARTALYGMLISSSFTRPIYKEGFLPPDSSVQP
jgi:hypothetical protein